MSQIHNGKARETLGAPLAGGRPGGTFAAGILEDPASFARLEPEWQDLYQNSPRATPFQS